MNSAKSRQRKHFYYVLRHHVLAGDSFAALWGKRGRFTQRDVAGDHPIPLKLPSPCSPSCPHCEVMTAVHDQVGHLCKTIRDGMGVGQVHCSQAGNVASTEKEKGSSATPGDASSQGSPNSMYPSSLSRPGDASSQGTPSSMQPPPTAVWKCH